MVEQDEGNGRRSPYTSTQGAVHRVTNTCRIRIPVGRGQLHRAGSRTNQLQTLRMDDGRRNGNTQKQREPHQHEARQSVCIAEFFHGKIIAWLRFPGSSCEAVTCKHGRFGIHQLGSVIKPIFRMPERWAEAMAVATRS